MLVWLVYIMIIALTAEPKRARLSCPMTEFYKEREIPLMRIRSPVWGVTEFYERDS
jgi:hypothetical protein